MKIPHLIPIYTEKHPNFPDRIFEDQTDNMGMEQGFAQWKHRFDKNISFIGGIHFQFLNINNSFAAEPRAALKYTLNSRNSFSIGYGMHSQAQNVYSYFIQPPTTTGITYTNKNLDFTQSQHFIAEYDLNVTSKMRVKVEGYFQNITKAPVTSYSSPYSALNTGGYYGLDNTDSLVNKGSGQNYGAELTIEHFLSKGFYFLITGSLVNSHNMGSDGVERNTAFNTGYVTNVLAGKECKVGKNSLIVINFKTSLIGGRYLTPIDPVASQIEGKAVYNENQAFSEKQKDYFRTDLKIAYRKEYKKSTMEFSLDLENIINQKNIFSQTYDARTNRIVYNYQQGFFPVPLFRYTF